MPTGCSAKTQDSPKASRVKYRPPMFNGFFTRRPTRKRLNERKSRPRYSDISLSFSPGSFWYIFGESGTHGGDSSKISRCTVGTPCGHGWWSQGMPQRSGRRWNGCGPRFYEARPNKPRAGWEATRGERCRKMPCRLGSRRSWVRADHSSRFFSVPMGRTDRPPGSRIVLRSCCDPGWRMPFFYFTQIAPIDVKRSLKIHVVRDV